MRTLLIAVLLFGGPTLACDYPPAHGPYDEPGNHSVDLTASSMAMMPADAAMGACAVVTAPADLYWKVKRPDEEFGTSVADAICPYPGAVVGRSIYLVSGFPLYAGKKIAGAIRARAVGIGQ